MNVLLFAMIGIQLVTIAALITAPIWILRLFSDYDRRISELRNYADREFKDTRHQMRGEAQGKFQGLQEATYDEIKRSEDRQHRSIVELEERSRREIGLAREVRDIRTMTEQLLLRAPSRERPPEPSPEGLS